MTPARCPVGVVLDHFLALARARALDCDRALGAHDAACPICREVVQLPPPERAV